MKQILCIKLVKYRDKEKKKALEIEKTNFFCFETEHTVHETDDWPTAQMTNLHIRINFKFFFRR